MIPKQPQLANHTNDQLSLVDFIGLTRTQYLKKFNLPDNFKLTKTQRKEVRALAKVNGGEVERLTAISTGLDKIHRLVAKARKVATFNNAVARRKLELV